MLPPGHIAAGYLAAYALIKITKPVLTTGQIDQLLWFGALMGFVPDLDTFFSFARVGSFTFNADKTDHRKYFTHAPIFWLVVGLSIFFTAPSLFIKYVGLIIWLGPWSHFFWDSLQYGIPWLWPFKKDIYAFRDKEVNYEGPPEPFFKYWFSFLKLYITKAKMTFYTEIILIVLALISLVK